MILQKMLHKGEFSQVFLITRMIGIVGRETRLCRYLFVRPASTCSNR